MDNKDAANGNIVVVNCQTLAEKVRLTRLAKHLRQIDLACQAEVSMSDVINLEKNRMHIIAPRKLEAILRCLDLLDSEPANHA